MPPPKSPQLYDLGKTAIAFSIASIVLLVSLMMMVFQDSDREWKSWQRQFMEYSKEKAEAQLHEVEKSEDQKKLEELKGQLAAAHAGIETHRGEIGKVRAELAQAEVEWTKAKTFYQDLKQVQESDRYFFEEARARHHEEEAKKYEARLKERAPKFERAKLDFEASEAKKDEINDRLQKFLEAETSTKREIQKLTEDAVILEKKIASLKPNWIKALLNAPMLDFIRPTMQVQQIVVENLYDDYYFSKPQKVDRCITCHLGIDQKDFADAPQPFKAHPRLDLFLSSDSPHPMETFGCTVCHGGNGQSVSFKTAAHTPQNEDQAKEWKKEFHWRELHDWSDKMLPLNHAEASCAKCHQGVLQVPKAEKLNEGRRLAQTFGCFACHKVKGFEQSWKVGPSLQHVQSKLEQDWIVRWLQNPKAFRPSTKMPKIFHLSNTSDPDSAAKNNAVITGIATYLIKNSEPVSLQSPPVKGNPEAGEKLVKELGCLGCHSVGSAQANDHGPELSGLGSKVKAEWLFSWLKDPKHYNPDTRMPNLRLTDEEASNITAYLLAQRNEKFESKQLPQVPPELLDDVALSYMVAGNMRRKEAEAELGKMNVNERLEFVGKKAIAHQGCFGCHSIKGFEDTKPIGTELTEEGSKDIHKFYFGFVSIEETRQAFFAQKLKQPRSFDQGKELPYLEKLRMPQFDFNDKENESLVTFLLSLQKSQIPLQMQKLLSTEDQEIETGRWLVAKLHCQGCHTLDGKEGAARALFEDKGNAPPVLDGEGKKVQDKWLYNFLSGPTPIRPWLKYRMPTFGFDEAQLNSVIQYFHHLSDVRPNFGETAKPLSTPEEIQAGRELFQKFQCIKCHKSNPEPGLSASFLAPDLVHAKERLRADWVLGWLKDPQALQAGTMMPTFFAEGKTPVQDILKGDADAQIKALRDYLWVFTPEEGGVAGKAKEPSPVKAA